MWAVGDVVLGVYEVRDVVRTGGMGLVYRVWHRQWGMDLAVKTPRQELVASPEDISRFEQEAEAWVRLGAHLHVVNCVYVRRIDGVPRVFAEWIDGGTLAEAVRERRLYRGGRTAALRRILDVAVQVAWGLEHAHRHGLIHQDVKPANVMLERDGTVKVTDFGLAKARAAQPGPGTNPLASFGGMTPAYCSPEQARTERLSVATDVWSWAVSVLEMFVGRPPSLSGQAAAGAFAKFTETGTEDSTIPSMPPDVVEVLQHCFTDDPAARPGSLGEIAEELTRVYQNTTGESYPREPPTEAQLLADGLSNQALSMVDLGILDRADDLWKRALQIDPRHPHATYNAGMQQWRNGRLTDKELIAELDAVRLSHEGDWIGDYLLALAHLERGDKQRAALFLRDLPDSPDIADARAEVDRLPEPRLSATLSRTFVRVGPTFGYGRAPFAISADGNIAAVTYRDRDLKVWSIDGERVLCTLSGHDADLESVALSAEGRVLVSGDRQGHVRVWNTGSGQCERTYDLPRPGLESVAVSADGTVVVAAGMDGSVRVLGDTIRMVSDAFDDYGPGFGGTVTITDDNQRVASFDGYRWLLRMWDRSTGQLLGSMNRLNQRFAFSASSKFALSVTEAETLWLINLHTYEVRDLGSAAVWGGGPLAVSDDGRVALSVSRAAVQRWQLDKPRCVFTTETEADTGSNFTISADCRVALVDLGPEGVGLVELPEPHAVAPWCYARPRRADLLTNDAHLARENLDLAAELLEFGRYAEAWKQLQIVRRMPDYRRHPRLRLLWRRVGTVSNLAEFVGAWRTQTFEKLLHGGIWAITKDLRHGIVGNYDGSVVIYDLETGQATEAVDQHDRKIQWATACADNRYAITNDAQQVMFVWDLKTAHRIATIFRADDGNLSLGPHASSLTLTNENDGFIYLWNLATQRPLYAWPGDQHKWIVLSGNVAITLTVEGHVDIFSVHNDRILRKIQLPSVSRIAASADGHIVVAAVDQFDNPGRVVLSRVDQPNAIEPTMPGGIVRCLDLTPDGELLLIGSDDDTVRLWSVRDGTLLCELEGIKEVSEVALSADGCTALTVEGLGTVKRWELDWEYSQPPG